MSRRMSREDSACPISLVSSVTKLSAIASDSTGSRVEKLPVLRRFLITHFNFFFFKGRCNLTILYQRQVRWPLRRRACGITTKHSLRRDSSGSSSTAARERFPPNGEKVVSAWSIQRQLEKECRTAAATAR